MMLLNIQACTLDCLSQGILVGACMYDEFTRHDSVFMGSTFATTGHSCKHFVLCASWRSHQQPSPSDHEDPLTRV